MSKKSGLVCKRCGSTKKPDKNGRPYCPCRYRHRCQIECATCGKNFMVTPKRLPRKKYCSKKCAYVGQRLCRKVWNKGLTRIDHPSIQRVADAVRDSYKADPKRGRGKNHPMYGRKHTYEARTKMSAKRKIQPTTAGMRRALDDGRRRKWTPASIAKRSITRKANYVFKRRPEHGTRMRKFYQDNPEKHPNRILAQKGYETKPERAMRLALETHGYCCVRQHRVGSRHIDLAIPSAMLAIEVDGLRWHPNGPDTGRDEELQEAGWRVFHFTDAEVFTGVDSCIAAIAAAHLTA